MDHELPTSGTERGTHETLGGLRIVRTPPSYPVNCITVHSMDLLPVMYGGKVGDEDHSLGLFL